MPRMLIPRSHGQTKAGRRWLADHPVLGFVVLAFGISCGLGMPWLVAVSARAPRGELVGTYLGRLFVVAGPALAVIAAAAPTGGRPRVLELLGRFRPVRRRLAWYLLLPLLTLGISLGAGSPRTQKSPGIQEVARALAVPPAAGAMCSCSMAPVLLRLYASITAGSSRNSRSV